MDRRTQGAIIRLIGIVLVLMLLLEVLVACGQPPYLKAHGERVHLVNNSSASDHPWQEIVAFLERDATDKDVYSPEHECGYFAEGLHNRAEYYGFRTAFVVVEFETGEPHALNAFNTIDYGLVYIDSTGKDYIGVHAMDEPLFLTYDVKLTHVEHWDKVAFIAEGEKMGFISVGYTEGDFSYSWYKKSRRGLATFKVELAVYHEVYLNYYGKTYNPLDFEEWMGVYTAKELLENMGKLLLTKWEEGVRGYLWEETESRVTSIKVYW